MTFLDAAEQILLESGKPLHYEEITRQALKAGLLTSTGVTPDATMASRLYFVTLEDGASPFVRVGKGVFDLARRREGGIEDEVEKLNALTRDRLKDLLHRMPAKRFEELIRGLLIKMGFDEETVVVTPYSSDGGIDVKGVFRAGGLTTVHAAVQAKRWKGNVQTGTVRDLRGSLEIGQQGTIITTSDFSSGARSEAQALGKNPIGLINGSQLVNLMMKHHVGVIEKPLVVSVPDEEYWGDVLPPQVNVVPVAPIPIPEPVVADEATSPSAPVKFILFGKAHPFVSWKMLLVGVVEELHTIHGEEFGPIALTVKGRTRTYIQRTPDGLISPTPIAGADFWLESNQSARSTLVISARLLTVFGHDSQDLQVA